MIVNYKKRKIKIPVKKVSEFGKISGLMFRTKNAKNLLFEFKEKTRIKIHSFFVFFKFLGVWLDEKNNVIEWKAISPFSLGCSPKKPFSKLVEIPVNNKNKKIIGFFVGKKVGLFRPIGEKKSERRSDVIRKKDLNTSSDFTS